MFFFYDILPDGFVVVSVGAVDGLGVGDFVGTPVGAMVADVGSFVVGDIVGRVGENVING